MERIVKVWFSRSEVKGQALGFHLRDFVNVISFSYAGILIKLVTKINHASAKLKMFTRSRVKVQGHQYSIFQSFVNPFTADPVKALHFAILV